MTLSTSYPSILPSLNLDFINTQALDPRITFTRASTGTYYDGKTNVLAEQNLITYSNTFNNSAWSPLNLSLTSNATAPDGTNTAYLITEDSSTGYHSISQLLSTTTGITYTLSCYVKANTTNFINLRLNDGGNRYVSAVFDLSLAGNVATQTVTGSLCVFTNTNITAVGAGWYRISVTGYTTNAVFAYATVGFANSSSGNTFGSQGGISYTGTSTNSFYVWGMQLEQRSSATAYNATTTTALQNYIPQLLSAGTNIPRFDWDPISKTPLGLLIERNTTNLLTYSQGFDNVSWSKTTTTVNANANIAPDGTQTAAQCIVTGVGGNNGHLGSAFAVSGFGTWTYSVYAKLSAGATGICLQPNGSIDSVTCGGACAFNLVTQSITANTTYGGKQTNISTSITPVGNNWFRCSMTFTLSGTTPPSIYGVWIFPFNNYSTDGIGSTTFLWGAQVEANFSPTSYIPTTSATATRADEAVSMPTTGWFNSGQGSFYVESKSPTTSYTGGNAACVLNLTGTGTRMTLFLGAGSKALWEMVSTVNVSVLSDYTITPNVYSKIAATYQPNNFVISSSGVQNTSTVGFLPAVNTLYLGTVFATGQLNGYIKKLTYYPQALTSTQLQTLTGN